MPIFDYACQNCGFKDFELRAPEHRDDPLACPKCAQEMTFVFMTEAPTVRIRDRKLLRLPGRKPVLKERTRVLGTKIGLIRPVELGNAVHDMEQKYARDIAKTEQDGEAKKG
jgi:putative FmdB family regulatory protein